MIKNRFKRCVRRHELRATTTDNSLEVLQEATAKTSYCSTYLPKILIVYNSGFYHVMHTYFDAQGRNWGRAVLAKSQSFLCCNAKRSALWLLSFEGPSLWLRIHGQIVVENPAYGSLPHHPILCFQLLFQGIGIAGLSSFMAISFTMTPGRIDMYIFRINLIGNLQRLFDPYKICFSRL